LKTLKSEVKEWRTWNGKVCLEGRRSFRLSYGRDVDRPHSKAFSGKIESDALELTLRGCLRG
jgi:uncharacterized protein (DUF2147 family)